MIASLKSELRKIYTVRSTYAILLFSLVLMIFFAFYTEGMKAGESSAAIDDPLKLANLIKNAETSLIFFAAIVGILSFTHEYRYNTIMYTLTSSRSRTKTLFAKIIAVSIFAVFFIMFVAVLASLLMYLGLAVKGYTLGAQTFSTDLIWRVLFMGWGSCMIALLIAAFIRQQVGTISAYFVWPALGESLVGVLLKDNSIYLPFTALKQVTGVDPTEISHYLSPVRAALVFMSYMVFGWFIAWILFLRRDAN